MSSRINLGNFEEGDRVLFNDRKTPLTVSEVNEDDLVVNGPSGGMYEIYFDEGTLLVCRKGDRRYSSYCEDLRSVGEWERTGDTWTHSKSDSTIRIAEKDNGFYSLKSEKFGDELDNPLYGFSDKEVAVEEVEKFISSNPEG